MPKHHQNAGKYPLIVRSIAAVKGGTFIPIGEHGEANFRNARESADILQRDFDEDADPVRVYIYKDGEPVPVYAGLQRTGWESHGRRKAA
jgi:hypothetical protein